MSSQQVAAVDLGATSGRVILGGVEGGRIRLSHVARFPNHIIPLHEGEAEGLHWDLPELFRNAAAGLAAAFRTGSDVVSVGIDSWAVDYALMRSGRVLGLPYNYRDARTGAGVASVHADVDAASLYRANGLQHLDFNTLFQLRVDALNGVLSLADSALMVPDLLGYWLTGESRTEITNASTTGLLDPRTGQWSTALFDALGLDHGLFAPLVRPGERVGTLLPGVAERVGAPSGVPLVAVGSHDTASAVVGVPMTSRNSAFISSGTWSLVGQELDAPVITEASREANFTNEGGVDGRTRFLKNVSGLWILTESMKQWELEDGVAATGEQRSSDLQSLLAAAGAVTADVAVFDAADARFVPPGDMPSRIASWCEEHGQSAPRTRPEFVLSILRSLASAYAETLSEATRLSGVPVETVHVVGGGSQNVLLCQLTADATGLPVVAGPVEATAIGNVLVQTRAAGLTPGSLEDLRSLVIDSFETVTYLPR
ncbi:MAG: rhamnulokinase [Galactobacter sp.]|uniref:rhamnulokinase n=1 Tax=Galactobacter sp. TaxID=2676125 RepID=UPI0025C43943|nr:rhamnulokinase family protein [Galactobacter sp.]